MKVLFNKLKKVNKIFLSIYIIIFILFLISYIFLVKNLLSLTSIETVIRTIIILLLGIWLIFYFLSNLVKLILKKHIFIAITSSITLILCVILGIVNYYIGIVNGSINNLVEKEYVTYTTNLITLNEANINEDSILGMINNSQDVEGNILAKELIEKEKLTNKVEEYSSYYEMFYDLLNKKIDGIFLSANYLTIFSEDEFEGLKNTKVAYTYSKKMKNQDATITSNKKLTEPFTILLMGVDSEKDGLSASTSFNGDTLMLITFNPKTLNATMFSIPRDTYVPIACNNNRYAKINSSAAYGANCVISTIEDLTDINIDYYLKINFKGVVDLVEALDGIDVDVEAPDYKAYVNVYKGKVCEQNSLRQFGDKLICIEPGMQHLNGEEALAYARCRHAYLASDIARNRHQQQIIEAMAKKAISKDNIGKLEEILNAITNNLETNMGRKEMLTFYEVLKDMVAKTLSDGNFLTIQKTYLEYYNLPVRLSNNGILLSAIGYYPGSLEAIVNLMKANLELEEKEIIKTFSFDASETYEVKPVGQGITTGEKLETVPNFVGLSVSYAEDWANKHNIGIDIQFVDSLSPYYNSNIANGMIANQSINNGVLINNVSDIILYVNTIQDNIPNEDDNQEEENTEEENENNDIDLPDIILPSEEE